MFAVVDYNDGDGDGGGGIMMIMVILILMMMLVVMLFLGLPPTPAVDSPDIRDLAFTLEMGFGERRYAAAVLNTLKVLARQKENKVTLLAVEERAALSKGTQKRGRYTTTSWL